MIIHLGVAALAAAPPPPTSALLTEVAGAVTLAGEPAVPYASTRPGDVLTLDKGATAHLVYLSGQVEQWSGPCTVVVGTEASTGKKGASAEKSTLDAAIVDGFRPLPALIVRGEAGPAGATILRTAGGDPPPVPLSADEEKRLAEARATYATWKASAAQGEYLPDLYLASILLEYELVDEAHSLLEPVLAACGACPAVAALEASARPEPP